MKKILFVIAAPSGAGKSTFIDRLLKEVSGIEDTTTYTTRSMRTGEREGFPYHFVSHEQFENKIRDHFFVEWARVHEHLYGTPRHQIDDIWSRGHAVIMDVDVQGAATFRRLFPAETVSIFIEPPSLEELKLRLTRRDGSLPSDFAVRMRSAEKELAQAHEFDYRLVNDDFETSYQEFKKLIEQLLISP